MTLTIIPAPDIGQHIVVVGGNVYYGDTPQDARRRVKRAKRPRPKQLIAPADLARKLTEHGTNLQSAAG